MNTRRQVESCIAAVILALLPVFAIIGLSLFATAQSSAAGATQERAIADKFGSHITEYLELRKVEASTPQKSSNSAQKVVTSEQQMAARVRSARPNASQGDIFTPEIAEYFRHKLGISLEGPEASRIRTSLRHAEPVQQIPLQVNQSYPKGVPLQSTPPSLLLNLPRLPKELQYRIVGHDLVLYDVNANLIVDFIPHAIPES